MLFKIREMDRAWYGLALRQELYTPKDLEDDTIRAGTIPSIFIIRWKGRPGL
jgi:hypothetical protein